MKLEIEKQNGNGVAKTKGGGATTNENADTTFWDSTDAETKTIVAKEYHTAQASSLSMRKKLSKSDQAHLAHASGPELEDMIQRYVDEAASQQEKMKKEGSKAERNMSKFLDNFNGYFQAYAGVIGIIKGAGFGQGEAAYGALQVLLITAVNKEKTEDFISKMLVELRQHYARIQMLKHVYLTDRMVEYTAVLYRLGVEFLHEAVRYYSMGTFRRLGHLVARPPSMGVEKKVKEIKDAIRETEREMRALDGRRLNDMEQTQVAMERQQKEDRKTLGEVRAALDVMQTKTDNERLEVVSGVLRYADFDIKGYEQRLQKTFNFPRKLAPLDVDAQVFSHPNFDKWRRGTTSSLFLAHGTTVAPDQTAYGWFSPAAVSLVSRFDSEFSKHQNDDVSVVLCHSLFRSTDRISSSQEKTSVTSMIATIIYQVLRSANGKGVIRDEVKFRDLKESLDDFASIKGFPLFTPTQTAAQYRILSDVFRKLLVQAEVQCLVIVVDRIDRVQGGMEKALDVLIDIMEKAKPTVKIFATARTRAGFDETDVQERLEGKYVGLTLNQDDQ